ncbi:MAG: hypothetical protein LBL33_08730 [Tannerella sp.]|jgi:hypothetical protein|nr:hypothetical protein [Tannerella sp.]
MKNIYNISYTKAALLLSPFILRKKVMLALLSACMRPLESLNERFGEYRSSVDASVNCQVCCLRGMLNDHFDYYKRRITVRTAALNRDEYLLWQEQYHKPVMIYNRDYPDTYRPFLLNGAGRTGDENADFEIVLPAGFKLSKDERNQLISLVNSHKLASKKFIITYGQH